MQILLSSVFVQAQVQLNLFPDKYGTSLAEKPYGIFFEEINHAADGGLWSEMVSNRSFEDNDAEQIIHICIYNNNNHYESKSRLYQ